jgi:hypothetical protein
VWIRDSTGVSAQSYHVDLPITKFFAGTASIVTPCFLNSVVSRKIMPSYVFGHFRDTIRDSQAHPTAAASR